MRTALHHLAKRGSAGTWYAVKAVPKDLRPAFGGKHHLLKNLATQDRAVALARRNGALDELERMIRAARQPARAADIVEAAMILRKTYKSIPDHDTTGLFVWQDGVDQATGELALRYGPGVADAFRGIATGTATALQTHLDAWLAEPGHKGELNERTKLQRRAVLNHLEKWLAANGHPATVEAITKQVAGAYITDTFITPKVHPITANYKVSVLSSYWRWLERRTGVEVNPWAGQSFRRPPKRTNGEKNKRPFTREEMVALLTGNADQETADAIRLAALSGMRLEEIYRLKVADCTGGIFDVRQSKTDAGVRKVPIHSALALIVERRMNGKVSTDWLMHEAGNPNSRERSATTSHRFSRYRQEVAVHDRAEGARHSRVRFPFVPQMVHHRSQTGLRSGCCRRDRRP